MRIAYIIGAFPKASETFVSREVLALRKRGLDVDVFSVTPPTPEERRRMPAEVQALVDSVHYVRAAEALSKAVFAPWLQEARELNERLTRAVGASPRPALRLLRAAAIAEKIRERGYDRIHAHWPYGTQLALLVHAITRLPLSASIHAHEVMHQAEHFPLAFERLQFAVFCNRAAMERLLATLPPGTERRCHLVYHGVDLSQFRPAPPREDDGVLRLFSAGRLTPTKGFDRLVRAVALSRDRGLVVELTIAGDGAERTRLQELASTLGIGDRVKLPGWIRHDELASVIRASDASVLLADTNFHDGLPNVIVETMASARPVIVSPLPAAEEAIRDGQTGFILSRPDASDELVTRLGQLQASPELRASLGQAARRAMEESFDEQLGYARMIRLFRESADTEEPASGRPTLSVVTIAKNEERDLPGFLRSFLPCADEIVIVDDGSSDRTAEIAQSAGPKVKLVSSPREGAEGFDAQRNKAIAAATSDWLLHVDVDMRITAEMAREVDSVLRNPEKDVWTYRRANYFLNQPLFHAMRGETRYPWLVRKGIARFSAPVHEVLIIDAPRERWGDLENRMPHLGDEDFAERLGKNLVYSRLERINTQRAGAQRKLWQVAVKPAVQALRTYVVDRAFLDGRAGVFWTLYQWSGSLNRYLLEYSDTLAGDREAVERRIAGHVGPHAERPQ